MFLYSTASLTGWILVFNAEFSQVVLPVDFGLQSKSCNSPDGTCPVYRPVRCDSYRKDIEVDFKVVRAPLNQRAHRMVSRSSYTGRQSETLMFCAAVSCLGNVSRSVMTFVQWLSVSTTAHLIVVTIKE